VTSGSKKSARGRARTRGEADLTGDLSAATLRALIEANFAICYEWSLEDDAIVLVGNLEALLGLSPDSIPTTGDRWLELVHPDDAAEFERAFDEAAVTGGSILIEYRMVRSDGGVVVVEDGGTVLSDERGEHLVMVGALRDVTAEREARRALEERTTALRVLLDQHRHGRVELERTVTDNLRDLVLPTLDRLARSLRARPEAAQLAALRTTLEEIVSPLAGLPAAKEAAGQGLTRREIEVMQLIRGGSTTAEIAETLHIGQATVTYHRQNIRRKLGLGPRSPHLSSHLLAQLGQDDDRDDHLGRLLGDELLRQSPPEPE
jgi:PAS domain S-box-containing protein